MATLYSIFTPPGSLYMTAFTHNGERASCLISCCDIISFHFTRAGQLPTVIGGTNEVTIMHLTLKWVCLFYTQNFSMHREYIFIGKCLKIKNTTGLKMVLGNEQWGATQTRKKLKLSLKCYWWKDGLGKQRTVHFST